MQKQHNLEKNLQKSQKKVEMHFVFIFPHLSLEIRHRSRAEREKALLLHSPSGALRIEESGLSQMESVFDAAAGKRGVTHRVPFMFFDK